MVADPGGESPSPCGFAAHPGDATAQAQSLDRLSRQVAADIRDHGYGTISNRFLPDEIDQARAQAEQALARNGGDYAGVAGNQTFQGAVLHDLAESGPFTALCSAVYSELYGRRASDMRLRQTLRCLTDRSAAGHSDYFHYDSYAITAVIPIAIPAAGGGGDLILLPNRRPLRRTYLANLIDKALAERQGAQRSFRRALDAGAGPQRVRLVPGNVYLFLGYRSLHANEPCGEGFLRATLILHAIDPHAGSPLKRLLGRLRHPWRHA